MTTTRIPLVIAAAAALGLAGWMAPGVDHPGNDEAPPSPRSGSPAQPKQPQYVLLTDGRLVTGVVSEEDNLILVTQPIGAMKFPRKRVEQVFSSLRKVYEYKLEQLPENDDDERVKLARWCLAQKLDSEARQQLEAILAHSPKHSQAKAMLVALDQDHERRARRMQDPEVQRTAGGPERGATDDRPRTLDTAVVSGASRGLGFSDTPVVFDLPPAQAVRRADEFARYVHPVLQVYCARCHDDRYEGSFQLIPFKNKADRTRDALRANLDACLRLVDRENPVRSELLASSLRPHGRGPAQRPIFRGSNDRAYQVLAAWVSKLQALPSADSNLRAAGASRPDDSGERFGSSRGRVRADQGSPAPEPIRFATGPVETKVLPPARFEPGKGFVPDAAAADPKEFPLPFAAAGVKAETPAGTPTAPVPATAPAPAAGDAGVLPASAQAEAPSVADIPANGPGTGSTDTAKKPAKKPIKLDPSLLQRALQLKNQGR